MDFSWVGCTDLLKRAHGVSLVNLGNECFINSVLNFVFHTPQLFRYIKYRQIRSKCTDCEKCVYCILNSYLTLIEDQFEKLEPTEMRKFVDLHFPSRIAGGQEDAHEMLTFLLEQLQSPTLFLVTRQKPWVKTPEQANGPNQLTRGKIASNIFCKACKDFRANNPEKIQELNLNLNQVNKALKLPENENRELDPYINAYFSTEALSDFACQKCGKKEVFRKYFLVEAPPLLIIQLKRFGSSGKKDMTNIDIPLELNLEKYFEKQNERKQRGKPPAEYRLYGYISHVGSSIQCGHYISTFMGYDGDWYLYDDEFIKPTYPNTTSVSQQYLLFYYRVGVKAPSSRSAHPTMTRLSRPLSSASPVSIKSNSTNGSERHSSNKRRMSSALQETNRTLNGTAGSGDDWWSGNNKAPSSSQKRQLNNQESLYDSSWWSGPPKRIYNPWEALTENNHYPSDEDENSRRF